ncbi:hypothetical protein RI129_000320 [Pyrocoelia pectoralis]|uniref:SH2 domain-containing protein n=1 Tax=Pyrocoelia pectoralis TaxID=417401 RepID=A0AAN7VS20_9COLE
MSNQILLFKEIESLNTNQLISALELNGYSECIGAIRAKNIDGDEFLKLTEVQISLWRLPITQSRRLWSFIQLIRTDPTQLLHNAKANNQSKSKKNIPPKLGKINDIVESSKGSSLTKQESVLLKNKLEEMFKNIEEIPNQSFIHQQRQPQLPPKPKHLKLAEINTEEPVDDNDEYLSPIEPRPEESFLSKYRKTSASASFENDLGAIGIKPKLTLRDRPLPPIPIQKILPSNDIDPEEELGEYTPVIESTRPLPKTPTSEDDMPEYVPVEDEISAPVPTKRALPPIPVPGYKQSPPTELNIGSIRKLKPQIPVQSRLLENKTSSPSNNVEQIKPKLLPKPPTDLPSEPVSFLGIENVIVNKVAGVHLSQSNVEDQDYSSDEYDQVGDELKNLSYYRETDRKGARMLLTGLEDGAFIIRPSRQQKYLCTISIMHTKKMFNIGIERNSDSTLTFGDLNQDMSLPKFYAIQDIINYFSKNPIPLYGEYVKLKHLLPPNKH